MSSQTQYPSFLINGSNACPALSLLTPQSAHLAHLAQPKTVQALPKMVKQPQPQHQPHVSLKSTAPPKPKPTPSPTPSPHCYPLPQPSPYSAAAFNTAPVIPQPALPVKIPATTPTVIDHQFSKNHQHHLIQSQSQKAGIMIRTSNPFDSVPPGLNTIAALSSRLGLKGKFKLFMEPAGHNAVAVYNTKPEAELALAFMQEKDLIVDGVKLVLEPFADIASLMLFAVKQAPVSSIAHSNPSMIQPQPFQAHQKHVSSHLVVAQPQTVTPPSTPITIQHQNTIQNQSPLQMNVLTNPPKNWVSMVYTTDQSVVTFPKEFIEEAFTSPLVKSVHMTNINKSTKIFINFENKENARAVFDDKFKQSNNGKEATFIINGQSFIMRKPNENKK